MTREQARDLLRQTLKRIEGARIFSFAEDIEELADLILAQRAEAHQSAATESSTKHEATLDVVFSCVQSARLNMESVRSFRHLEKHDPQAINDWGQIDTYVAGAIADLTKAGNADDRIPF